MTALLAAAVATFEVSRAWRYAGHEGCEEDSLLLVDGQEVGGAYLCAYNPADSAGWGHDDGGHAGESWASWGARGLSCGHPAREAAEQAQLRAYAANPDLFDRLNARDRAEKQAAQDRREAETAARDEARAAQRRRERLGDDLPGPVLWTLPAYHALYAGPDEVGAVSRWLDANGIEDVSACHEVRVEQRASRHAVVYESVPALVLLLRGLGARGRAAATETRVVTLVTEPPQITTPPRPDLHELLEEHWPARFPLIDYGQTMACGRCTSQRGESAERCPAVVPWPCPPLRKAIRLDQPGEDQ